MKIGWFCLLVWTVRVDSKQVVEHVYKVHNSLMKLNTAPHPNIDSSGTQDVLENMSKEAAVMAFVSACEKRRGVDLKAKIRSIMPNVTYCLLDVYENIPSHMDDAATTCHTLKGITGCSKKFSHVIKVCYPESDTVTVALNEKIQDTSVSYACDDNAPNLRQFLAGKAPECLENLEKSTQTCLETYQQDNLKFFASVMNAEDYPPPLKKLRLQYCRQYVDLRNCLMSEVTKCPDQFPVVLIEKVTAEVNKVLSCEEFAPCEVDSKCDAQSRWSFSTKI